MNWTSWLRGWWAGLDPLLDAESDCERLMKQADRCLKTGWFITFIAGSGSVTVLAERKRVRRAYTGDTFREALEGLLTGLWRLRATESGETPVK